MDHNARDGPAAVSRDVTTIDESFALATTFITGRGADNHRN